jgi:hypothetical protein
MSWLRRLWHDLTFWLSGIPYAAVKTWQRFTHLAEDVVILALGFAIAFFFTSGSDVVTRDRAVDGFVGAGLAFGVWLAIVFVWNLVLSYPRKHWNLQLALSDAESKAAQLRYQRDFYKNADRKRLQAAARLLKTELRDIQEKVELIEATVAGHTYWDGFAFPAGEWQKYRELVAGHPGLYAAVEAAYVKANRANEAIFQRRTRAGPGVLIGRADEEDLPAVSAFAGEAIAALDALIEEGLPAEEGTDDGG